MPANNEDGETGRHGDAGNKPESPPLPVAPSPRLLLPPGGILIGIGTDIIEVERVRGVLERQGERFLHRVFTDEERAYCSSMAHPHKHYAARFAAKEAISKCF